ncbi:MAG: ribonuclease J [Alphaproteobacteria bacterium]|nr:ribonuclease J [Alphaproteobacteria bacterium]
MQKYLKEKLSDQDQNELLFIPLGGLGEIGMNISLYGFGNGRSRKWIMVDLGMGFSDQTFPGIEKIMPDIEFIKQERSNLLALILTHAHEDHFGGVIDLWSELQVPVYATSFAISLLRTKMIESGSDLSIPFYLFPTEGQFSLGPFDIEAIPVPHSIPESRGIVIRTQLGMIYHSGDWRIDPFPQIGDPIDIQKFKQLGEEKCNVLVCDSTNAMCEGVGLSESDVLEALIRVIGASSGLVLVTTFASNVARLRSVMLAAQRHGRKVVITGRAMRRVVSVAQETGYLEDDLPPFLDEKSLQNLPRNEIVVLISGSQGESGSALTRLAFDNYPHMNLVNGDTVIFSARVIPGNEKSVEKVHNMLVSVGVRVITERDDLIHVSGHPQRGELVQMYDWLKPSYIVPVHGTEQHMEAQVELARSKGIKATRIQNGKILRLLPGEIEEIGKVPSGRLYKDGNFLVQEMDEGLLERKQLSQSGCVMVSLLMSQGNGSLIDYDAVMFGFPDVSVGEYNLREDISIFLEEVIMSLSLSQRNNSDIFARSVKRALRAKIGNMWGKRPICHVILLHC